MKKYKFVFLALFLAGAVWAQDLQGEAAVAAEDLPQSAAAESLFAVPVAEMSLQPIIHRGGFFSLVDYKLPDGTKLSYTDVNDRIKQLPQNQPLMARAALWKGTAITLLLGAVAAGVIDSFAVKDDWATAHEVCVAACAGSLFASCLTAMAHQSYRSAAVDTYNLYVMGVKLP